MSAHTCAVQRILTRHPRVRVTILLWILLTALFPTSAEAISYVSPATGQPYATGVLRRFDAPLKPWLSGHRGVDLELNEGDPVRASGDGVVGYIGTPGGIPTLAIDHPDGLRSTYQPVNPSVHVGDQVHAGEIIGTLHGQARGWPGLQWGVLRGKDDYVNPLALLAQPKIRLKPPQARG